MHNKSVVSERRRVLRHRLTPAEAYLWTFLKRSKLDGRKFRRQHSVGPFILDFYCVDEWLGVELDGEVHRSERAFEYDHSRKLYLSNLGIKVIRFENFLVFEDIESVLNSIRHFFGWKDQQR